MALNRSKGIFFSMIHKFFIVSIGHNKKKTAKEYEKQIEYIYNL
jgi:hypothetical protein